MKSASTYAPPPEKRYCFLPNCKNNSENSERAFFIVPSSAQQAWCEAVGAVCPKRKLYICDVHLNLEEDMENYLYWKTMGNVKCKLKSAVPRSLVAQQLIPADCPLKCTLTEPSELNKPEQGTSFPGTSSIGTFDVCKSRSIAIQVKPTIKDRTVLVKPKTEERTTNCSIQNKKSIYTMVEAVQSLSDIEEFPSTQGSTTSVGLLSEMSSDTFQSIGKVENIEGRSFMIDLVEKKPEIYIGLPKHFYWLIEFFESKLKLKSLNIIITLFKIKNNIPFHQICDMFQISHSTIWRNFYATLAILAKFFEQFIDFPDSLQIKRNLPSSFKTSKEFSNVFCIIDCFEIEIEKPSNPTQQSLTWSQYKNANTLKYLLAITPDGLIIFVSPGFGGRISDANIIESSGFLAAMPSKCTILADRGFKHVESVLNRKGIKLLRPPSVSKGTKLSKQEALKSKVIASLRIHVERAIRRIRLFKFLKPHSVINNKLVEYTDDVVTVSCGLINLQDSIVKST